MELKHILLEKDGPVATITFNRPDRMNCISVETVPSLLQALHAVEQDESVRVLVMTGAGPRAFCSGADIADMVRRSPDEVRRIVEMYLDYIRAIRDLPVPVVAKVNGVAAGGGVCTALACDVRVASDQARFGFVFVNVGLAGADMGATYFLPRVVGLGKATELLYGGEVIDAQEAFRIGLVNRVVPHAELDHAVDDYARKLAAGPPLGLRMTKRALNGALDRTRDAAFDLETYVQTLCILSEDHLEGAAAFREKRAPRYTGR
ncbi:MAG: enoyl-CoA hydratase [Dehalococcoidia bacterium]|nr:enoyl-CoA hydratase [Dehalococcoidia bacterium]